MDNAKKKNSNSQVVLNVLLVIVCCVIFGLFVFDYINKNAELTELKNQQKKQAEEKEIILKNIKSSLEAYRTTAIANAPEPKENATPEEKAIYNEKIARDVTSNIAPLFTRISPALLNVTKGQKVTLKNIEKLKSIQKLTTAELNKIQNKLLKMLKNETLKTGKLRKNYEKRIMRERAVQGRLQRDLTETRKVVSELNGMFCELKAKYLEGQKNNTAIGDIAKTAAAPAKFVQHFFTADWFKSREYRKEKAQELKKNEKEPEIIK